MFMKERKHKNNKFSRKRISKYPVFNSKFENLRMHLAEFEIYLSYAEGKFSTDQVKPHRTALSVSLSDFLSAAPPL